MFPVKVLYEFIESSPVSIQAGVTVSSRTFRKAVDRNKVKRVLREVYRLQKPPLQSVLTEKNAFVRLFFIYTGKELPVFIELCEKMGITLQKLQSQILKMPPKD